MRVRFEAAGFLLKVLGRVTALCALLLLVGCGGSGTVPVTVPVTPPPPPASGSSGMPATVLYFANGTEYGSLGGGKEGWLANLLAYPANSSGSVSATAVVTSLNLTDRWFCIATDSQGNVYIATHVAFGPSSQGEVLVYAPMASGMAMPVRTITVTGSPTGLVVDASDSVYVMITDSTLNPEAPAYSIVELAAGASGSAAPIRTIALGVACTSLAVDGSRNLICVPSGGVQGMSNELLIFGGDQSGPVAPARTIVLDANAQIVDVAVDASGDIFVAVIENETRILEIVGGAGGAGVASAVAGIPDGALGSDFIVSHLRFDAAGALYVFGLVPSVGQSVLRFAPAAGGFATPVTESLVSPVFPQGFVDPVVAGFAVH